MPLRLSLARTDDIPAENRGIIACLERRCAVRIELLPGINNVIRFPVEPRRSTTLATLRELAPDCRKVLNLADAFGLEAPCNELRDRTDEETAGFIALQAPPRGHARVAMLKAMEEQAMRRALDACRHADGARRAARAAVDALASAEAEIGQFLIDSLRQKAGTLAEQAAILLLQAHQRCEEAEGVARAVGFAREDQAWFPRNHDDETDALIAMGAAGGR
jgi:hypothetical protein